VSSILVTGATGFTGGALTRQLVSQGANVVTFVRPSSDTSALEELGVDCRVVDIKDRQQVFDNFEAFDRVFHIAAAYRSEHSDEDEFRLVNVEATRHLLDAARQFGVGRFVHCSTVGVQGEIEDPPASEGYRFKPGDHYQQSKLEGELLALQYFDQGLPGAVVRPVGIYGPGDTRFLKLFRPISKGRFVMIGSGNVLYHMTYIDDLVQGFLLAGEHPKAIGEVFTIGGPQYTTLNELVAAVAKASGGPKPKWKIPFAPVYWASVICDRVCKRLGVQPPLYPRRTEFFQLDRAFSIEKARQLLGYDPQFSLEQGLQRTADWYRENDLI
jgi:nucleoside-diphosphate-sugar epimerase